MDAPTFLLDRKSIEKIKLRKLFVKSHYDAPARDVLNIMSIFLHCNNLLLTLTTGILRVAASPPFQSVHFLIRKSHLK